ncbi:hypothetical protein D3C78_1904430 [compost metagenome]
MISAMDSAGATAARIPELRSTTPEAIDMLMRPILSTRKPVINEGRYIAPI